MESKPDEKEILKVFENSMKNYKEVGVNDTLEQITERQLPKIRSNDTTNYIINKVNEVLSAEIAAETDITLEGLHTLIYCGGQTVTKLCEKYDKIFVQSQIPQTFPKKEEAQQQLFENSVQHFRRLLFDQSLMEFDEAYGPPINEIAKRWAGIWGQHAKNKENEEAEKEKEITKEQYKEQERERIKNLNEDRTEETDEIKITMKDLKRALKSKKSWSPPGIDGVQTFWYKMFKPAKKVLLKKINNIIMQKEDTRMYIFFTVGLTYMYPKIGNTLDPSNYRPITHLPSIYKIITRCIHQKILEHYELYKVLADEQCGGRRDCYGVRKAIVIDAVALDQKSVQGRYVDFKKAFDSVAHEWIWDLLEIYRVNKNLVQCLKTIMENWKTRICIKPDSITSTIKIEKGVFHGDCISVILFWTAINPLSFALQDSNKGLKLSEGEGTLSHLLYMDDLKLYAPSNENLESMYEIVKTFAEAIGMEVNERKSHPFSTLEKKQSEHVYLGYIQNPRISHETIYHKVRKFEEKYKKIDNTRISDDNKKTLKQNFPLNSIFNTFGILHWTLFKRELLMAEVSEKAQKKFLPEVKTHASDLPPIYQKLINDMCKMRTKFLNQSKDEKKSLMELIAKNDRVTPLMLAEEDIERYIRLLVLRFGRKRKVTD